MKLRVLFATLAIAAAAFSCGKDDPFAEFQKEFSAASEWSIIGTIGGDSWTKDIAMKTNGTWHAAFGVTVTETWDDTNKRYDYTIA